MCSRRGAKGNADLVSYFFLRAITLLNSDGNLGLIATNSIAQGDTREVGLKQMVGDGFTITRAIQSRSWPSASANLEYAGVWGSRGSVDPAVPRISDDLPVSHIATLLEPGGDEDPVRLTENARIAFIGCYVLGMGFVIEPEEAKAWIEADARNAEVLFPYLSGEDLNTRPDMSAPRWVIDFNDRPEEQARSYRLPYRRLLERVKAERAKKPKMVSRAPWWLFCECAPGLQESDCWSGPGACGREGQQDRYA